MAYPTTKAKVVQPVFLITLDMLKNRECGLTDLPRSVVFWIALGGRELEIR